MSERSRTFGSAGRDEIVAVRADYSVEVTWGGIAGQAPDSTVPPSVSQISDHLIEIAEAGATWAVCTWPSVGSSPEMLAEAAHAVRGRVDGGSPPMPIAGEGSR